MDIFSSKIILDLDEIVKEGWLVKQSKYRKVWRERWCVLTMKNIYTFKSEKVYSSPTETIDVNLIKTVKSDENTSTNIFKIEQEGQIFCFQAKSFEEKEAWIGAIGDLTLDKLLTTRQDHKLSLRKEHIFESIMDKRLSSTSYRECINYINSSSEPNLTTPHTYFGLHADSIKIPEEDKYIYTNLQNQECRLKSLSEWVKINDESNEYSYKKFAIFEYRKIYGSNNGNFKYKEYLYDPELVKFFMSELLKTNDLQIQFELSFILVRITFFTNTNNNTFTDSDFLENLLKVSYLANLGTAENILNFFGNLVIENREYILNNTNFLLRLKEYLMDDKLFSYTIELPNPKNSVNIPNMVIWNLNNIVLFFSEEDFKVINDIIPNILKYFSKENIRVMKSIDPYQSEMSQILTLLSHFSNNDSSLKVMSKNQIIDYLIYLLAYINIPYSKNFPHNKDDVIVLNPENLKKVVKLLGNLFTLHNQEYVELIRNNGDFLIEIYSNILMRYKLYHKDDRIIINEIIWSLSNFATGPKFYVDNICLSKIPEFLLNFYMRNEEIIEHVLIFFENALENISVQAMISILKCDFLKKLGASFKNFDKPQIILSCLNCFKFIIYFIKAFKYHDSLIYGPNPIDFVIKEIEESNIITRLEQICLNNNKSISEIAEQLLSLIQGSYIESENDNMNI